MKQSINFSQFVDKFNDYNRSDNFSYDGLKALFEYFEQYEDDCGLEVELDVIAICCEFTEYESLDELTDNYTDAPQLKDYDDNDDGQEDWYNEAFDYFANHTTIFTAGYGFIIQDY